MKKIKEIITYDSSTIKCSEYNFLTKELLVEFNNGKLYNYTDVENEEYINFSTSDSVGKSFSTIIKTKPFQKLN